MSVSGSLLRRLGAVHATLLVLAAGRVESVGNGSATITATSGSVSADLAVRVAQVPVSVELSPDSLAFGAIGDTATAVVAVSDGNGHEIRDAAVTWSSDNIAVAAVDDDGVVRATGNGATFVRARSGAAEGSAWVSVVPVDRHVLIRLYEATSGPEWTHNENWLTAEPMRDWHGVRVDSGGRVTELDLGDNGLAGEIPPELGQLGNLQRLDLRNNYLTGEISPELGQLANLQLLNLYNNHLTGEIPPELGQLGSLQTLNLWRNELTGPIPPELVQLANLQRLYLNDNELTGSIPPELGQLGNLWILRLGNNALTGSIPPELGQLGNLRELDVHNNELTGPIPPELGNLASLMQLILSNNGLTGRIPPELGQLGKLESLYLNPNDGLCVPGIRAFSWADTLAVADFSWCNEIDIGALEIFHESAGGGGWRHDDRWLGSAVLDDWYGVDAEAERGRVTRLELGSNDLDGGLSAGVGEMAELRTLKLNSNPDLGGRLPISLARLSQLDTLWYDGTGLCTPTDTEFRQWLRELDSHVGSGTDCGALTDRDVLVELYRATGGPSWNASTNWLTDKPLNDWHGVRVDAGGRVTELGLGNNALTGPIPPELGSLDSLESLYLYDNALTGPIPPELGNLDRLRDLRLNYNALTGPIPRELGNLVSLQWLYLNANELTGPIPPELGQLDSLRQLYLYNNGLTGGIPPELGHGNLVHLAMGGNAGLSGVLPDSLTNLDALEALLAGNTGVCAPADSAFQAWLKGVRTQRVSQCAPAAAYLTQAVQSREHPVPLVAREDALLRAFVTAANPGGHTMPRVVARLYRDGDEVYEADIPAGSNPLPDSIDESSLKASANAVIPGRVVRPGLELVVEVDPDGTLHDSVGVTRRTPAEGRLAIEVLEAPRFDLTLIPFLYEPEPDSSIIGRVGEMAADEDDHDLLQQTAYLLGVEEMDVTAHSPVEVSSRSGSRVLSETEAIRALEGGTGHWMGMMPWFSDVGGVAYLPGWTSASRPYSAVIVHELGHNFSLPHAPCGGAPGPDPRGRIGAWGYALDTVVRNPSGRYFRKGELVRPSVPDLMSYCYNPEWISDYFFAKAHRYRVDTEGGEEGDEPPAPPERSLLLWGGVDSTGTLHLEPAFVVDAPAALPEAAGDHVIEGRSADGAVLFSLAFEMPRIADAGEGAGGFAFVLPVRPEWGDNWLGSR